MSDFDLDIQNYSIKDLEQFFKLKKNYTENDIEYKEYEIREQLLSSGHVNKHFQKELVDFLKKAKDWLVYSKFGKKQTTDTPAQSSSIVQNLITHPDTKYIHANNSDIFAGTLNPLNIRFTNKYITIDTRFRDDTSKCTKTNDFSIQLPTKLNKVVSMQLSDIEIPNNLFNIAAGFGNNYLYLEIIQHKEDGTTQNYNTILIIPDGFYTDTALLDKINNLLCPIDNDGNIIYPDNIFSYINFLFVPGCESSGTKNVILLPKYKYPQAYSIVNIELNFIKGIDGIEENIHMLCKNSKIGWNLGFIHKIYTGGVSYTGESPMNLNTIKYIYLSVDDYQRSVNRLFMSAFTSTNFEDNVLARISVKTPNTNLITEPRTYFGPVDIQKLHIRLYDDFGRILNTNNMDFSFVLLFKMVYDL